MYYEAFLLHVSTYIQNQLLTFVLHVLGTLAVFCRAGVSRGHFAAGEDGAVEQNSVCLSGTHSLTDTSVKDR